MGDAFICRRGGGGVFRGLTVISPPTKTAYFPGQYVDMTGAVIGVDIGSFVVPIDYTGLYSPTRALTAADTAITVTATFGNITKSVQIPINMLDASATFGDNSWGAIAYISSIGEANNMWSVGDTKTENGLTYTIIGMSHDNLSGEDAKYNDTSYNRNTKKAGLTIQIMTANGIDHMNETDTNVGGWNECYMRNTVLTAYLAGLPSDLRAVIRTVDKQTSVGGYNTTSMTTSKDKLFLLALSEIRNYSPAYDWIVLPDEIRANPRYEYYLNGGSIDNGWTRSPHAPAECSQESHFMLSSGSQEDAGTKHFFYPAFCI